MIYLVRHGEAAAGWGDHPDPGLSVLGQKQSKSVSHTLLKRGASSVLTSPMQRCRETAAPLVRKLSVEAHVTPLVSEIITPSGATDRVDWLKRLMAGVWPENLKVWCHQAFMAIECLPDETAVFTHFVAINAIVGQVMGIRDVLVFKPGHCSVTCLERDAHGVLKVNKLGDEAVSRIL